LNSSELLYTRKLQFEPFKFTTLLVKSGLLDFPDDLRFQQTYLDPVSTPNANFFRLQTPITKAMHSVPVSL
jgi:hypothetical protein